MSNDIGTTVVGPMNRPVTIRLWDGANVLAMITVSPTGYSTTRAGGAENGARPDIEMDPWRGLIVDHRSSCPTPVPITDEQ